MDERSKRGRNPSRLRASMGNSSRGVTDCQLSFLFTDAPFESRGLIRMRLEEVERLEGVGGGLIDLMRLWKCVEKLKTTPICGPSPGHAPTFIMIGFI